MVKCTRLNDSMAVAPAACLQSLRWGITSPLLYASLEGVAAPAKTWALWGTDLRINISTNATAKAAITPVWRTKVAHLGPIGGSCTFQGLPWGPLFDQCTPGFDKGPGLDGCSRNDASKWHFECTSWLSVLSIIFWPSPDSG